MAALRDLTETGFDPDLHLPIRGKTYTVKAPTTHEDFTEIRRMVITEGLPAVEQIDQAIAALGDTAEQMFADEIPTPMILHAGRTALLHFGWSPDMGAIYWQTSHLPRLVGFDKVGDMLAEGAEGNRRDRRNRRRKG